MAARKLTQKRLVKYVNINIGHRFLVHIMFKVSSIDICICNYSTLFNVVTYSVVVVAYSYKQTVLWSLGKKSWKKTSKCPKCSRKRCYFLVIQGIALLFVLQPILFCCSVSQCRPILESMFSSYLYPKCLPSCSVCSMYTALKMNVKLQCWNTLMIVVVFCLNLNIHNGAPSIHIASR